MKYREGKDVHWTVPYLPIDPTDVGRVYEADVIRINSQSGKGGIAYVLETQFKLNLPAKMRESFGYHIKGISDRLHKELKPADVYDIFLRDYVNISSPVSVVKSTFTEVDEGIEGVIAISNNGEQITVSSKGTAKNAPAAEATDEFDI